MNKDNKKFIIEGVQIYSFGDESLKKYPMIFVQASVLKSIKQRWIRNGNGKIDWKEELKTLPPLLRWYIGEERSYNKFKKVKTGNYLVETLACTFMFCSGSNVFVRKKVVDELGGFDPSFQRQQDYEFLVRLFEKYSLIAIPEILLVKNQENFNLPNIDKQIAIRKQYLNKFQNIIENLDECNRNYIFHSQTVSLAEGAMRNKNYKIANLYYAKAKKYGRLTTVEWIRRLMFPMFTLFH